MYYDSKVRASTIQKGDTVLIRNNGLNGKYMYKLADKLARDTYIVINQPNSEIPVFQVKKEYGNKKLKTLQRNILLPISFIPILSEQSRIIQIPSQSVQNKCSPKKVAPIPDKTSKDLLALVFLLTLVLSVTNPRRSIRQVRLQTDMVSG